MKLLIKLKKFIALSAFEKKLIWYAWWWSLAAKILIPTVPFRRFKSLLGAPMVEHCVRLTPQEQLLAKQIKSAVSRADRLLPFHCQCFVLAIAAQRLLLKHKVPTTLYLGVAKDPIKTLKAHAWVRSGTMMVTGGAGHQAFTVTATFS